ncbi:BatD family protein [Candidatus Dependentiae bacterium]|nr:BatD family protein [Candidatus Dependentiae bacterium]
MNSKNKIIFLLFLIINIILIQTDISAEILVKSVIDKNVLYIGDQANITIEVNSSTNDRPSSPSVDGLNIVFSGGPSHSSMQNISIINGKMQSVSKTTTTYSFSVTAYKPGTYNIPPFSVKVDGKQYQSNRLNLAVSKPPVSDEMIVEQILKKESVYINTPVDYIVKWYVTKNVGEYNISVPGFLNKNIILRDLSNQNQEKKQNITVNGNQNFSGWITTEKKNDINYTVINFGATIYPKEQGIINFPPVNIKAKVVTGTRTEKYRDFFGYVRQQEVPVVKELYASSNQLKLNVSNLPSLGKFGKQTNLVGKYSISTKTDLTKLNVGDPMILTINVKGTGLMDPVELPDIESNKEINDNFDIGKDATPGEMKSDGTKEFSVTIRPKSDKVKEFPSIELIYFNPNTGKYEKSFSKPIQLTVKPTVQVTGKDLVTNQKAPAGFNIPLFSKEKEQTNLIETATGIMANYSDNSLILKTGLKNNNYLILLFSIIPVSIYLLIYIIMRYLNKLKTDSGFARNKFAESKFKTNISKLEQNINSADNKEFFEQAAKTAADYIGDKFNLPQGEFTLNDLNLLKISGKLTESAYSLCSEILIKCDEARFSVTGNSESEKTCLINNLKKIPVEVRGKQI